MGAGGFDALLHCYLLLFISYTDLLAAVAWAQIYFDVSCFDLRFLVGESGWRFWCELIIDVLNIYLRFLCLLLNAVIFVIESLLNFCVLVYVSLLFNLFFK